MSSKLMICKSVLLYRYEYISFFTYILNVQAAFQCFCSYKWKLIFSFWMEERNQVVPSSGFCHNCKLFGWFLYASSNFTHWKSLSAFWSHVHSFSLSKMTRAFIALGSQMSSIRELLPHYICALWTLMTQLILTFLGSFFKLKSSNMVHM